MYFWFFPAAFNPEKAPLLVWLQGGPGGSSLFGLFTENGPFIIDKDNGVSFRNTAWSLTHSVIYFDNPVGTGFSYTEADKGYARDETDVARDLYEALQQFYTLFPEYQSRDFYVTGESYAGKYVPAISYKIHTENQGTPKIRINLKGLAIGDGFSDPVTMLNYGEYLYNIGLLDQNGKAHFDQEEEKARRAITSGKYMDAFLTIDALLDGDLTPGGVSYFKNVTGLDFYFNFLLTASPEDQNYYSSFVQLPSTRRSIHVGNVSYNDLGGNVEKYLRNDMYQSVKPWIQELLDAPEQYQILMYSGQLDIIVASTLTDSFIRSMKWNGSDSFQQQPRKIWRVGKDIAGYAKNYGSFTQVIVRNAGHMVPYDQPKWAFDMINRFTAGKPFA
jgi:vitellogenic carboxypeptidase-like protein